MTIINEERPSPFRGGGGGSGSGSGVPICPRQKKKPSYGASPLDAHKQPCMCVDA